MDQGGQSWRRGHPIPPSIRRRAWLREHPPRSSPTSRSSTRSARSADRLAVVDVDPRSSSYASIVGRTEVAAGDELHHFGWNACSSCLCPNAPHPHVERRYLIVPGLRSSNIHILDTKPDPKNPKLVRTITAEELAERAGYSRPHTVHCGPEGIYVSALGNAEGKAPGGIFLIDHDHLRRARPLGDGPRPAGARLRLLVASRPRHAGDERMGHPGYGGERAHPRADPGRQVRPPAALLGPAQAQERPDHRLRRQVPAGVRAAPGARSDQGLRLRQLRALARGPVVVDLDLVSRRREVGGQEGDRPSRRSPPTPTSCRPCCRASRRCRRS